MKTFVDAAGRTWTIAVNVATIKRVKALLGFSLIGLIDDGFKGLGELLADDVKLVDTLYCLCEDEAAKLGVTDEDFGRAMYGDAIANGADAFLEEYKDFFREPRQREALAAVIQGAKRVQNALADKAMVAIAALDVDALAQTLITPSGVSPAKSVSTPAHSLLPNS